MMEILNIGYDNIVLKEKIVAIVNADSKPARRIKEQAAQTGRLIDATCGRKTRALILTHSNHIVLSAINVQTLTQRIRGKKG
ncbi:MAG: DUF370 domain-containing protein [Candidatus Saelkia tenebricola]|nr:DUF370 domain-containing protein [Candidatus Saelkia tenebricola]